MLAFQISIIICLLFLRVQFVRKLDKKSHLNLKSNDEPINWKKPKNELINSLLLNILVSTTIMILAVDFSVFPRRNGKIEHFGLGLMDAGAICFLSINAILSPEIRLLKTANSNLNSIKMKILSKNAYTCSILLVVGLIRLLTIKNLNYQEHVSEYGVHMNFFLLIVLIKLLVMAIALIFGQCIFNPAFGFSLICLHEILLKQFSDYIQQDGHRKSFLDKNKESFYTLIGYIGFYISCFNLLSLLNDSKQDEQHLNNSKCLKGESNNATLRMRYNAIFRSLKYAIVYFAFYKLSDQFSEQISRRNINMAFTCLMLSIICFTVCFEILWTILFDQYYSNQSKLIIKDAYTSNGLIVFLLSNILTGFVNMTTNTMQTNDLNAIILLFAYSFVVSISICFLNCLNRFY